jgi:p-hydroxybenzoate 3-monooxygenase
MTSGTSADRTQVGIVGAGPAGLMLSHLLTQQGIESIVLEARPREYVERRVRAGVLEQATVDLLVSSGLGEGIQRAGLVQSAIELRFDGQAHQLPLSELADGRTVTIFDQHQLVNDLIRARVEAGGQIVFEATALGVDAPASEQPRVPFRQGGQVRELACDVVAGCDGFWGVCRSAMPAGQLRTFQRACPFAWLGILATGAPEEAGLVYAAHERGFALSGLRSGQLMRVYVQWRPDEPLDAWPDDRLWQELQIRLGNGDAPGLAQHHIVEKAIATLRSQITEPMQYGRLFLAGDAAHIVTPTGAKGMNLAIADARTLAEALVAWYHRGTTAPTCWTPIQASVCGAPGMPSSSRGGSRLSCTTSTTMVCNAARSWPSCAGV